MTDATPAFRWRSIALPALLPTALFSTGEGAIIPVIPVIASNMGASLAIAGFIAAMLTVGELAGDLPGGWVVGRLGERGAMLVATGVSLAGVALAYFVQHPIALGVGILMVGLAAAVFGLARHAFMTTFVPIGYRARALSTLGGTHRLGLFIGPFITAALISLTGAAESAILVFAVACVIVATVLLLLPDPESLFTARSRGATAERQTEERVIHDESTGLLSTLRRYRSLLLRLGLGAASIGALRASRQVILPLWALSIGLDGAHTALIIGIAGAVDFALFYTGGQIMDRFGRLFTAVPSIIGLSAGHIALAFTHGSTANEMWFTALALFLSIANGIGAGILMTLGSDLAPPRSPAQFLGVWRLCGHAGGAAAPLAIAAITAAASLPVAAAVIGIVGLSGAGMLLRYLPRYSTHT